MFIDDTGDVTQNVTDHPQQRYAGITGVILELSYIQDKFDAGLMKLKEKHFGRLESTGKPPILHLRKMKMAAGPFECLTDENRRRSWETDCLQMYEKARYHVVSVGLDKLAFKDRYPNWAGSFYRLLVGNALERYFYFLTYNNGVGDIVAEGCNPKLDGLLKRYYRHAFVNGADHISAEKLQKVLTTSEIKIKTKAQDVQGLQLADLLASTCFAHCRRVYDQGPTFDKFAMKVADLIEKKKFYRDPSGNPHRYGRVWRPEK